MSDPFAILRGGTRFTRKPTQQTVKTQASHPHQEQILDRSLDFFGISQSAPDPPVDKSRKRKRRKLDRNTNDTENNPNPMPEVPSRTVEQVQVFRKRHRIFLKGNDIPNPIFSFDDLKWHRPVVQEKVLSIMPTLGFNDPTPIQLQAIPIMLARKHMLAIAPTGSGKTLAFSLPVIAALQKPMALGFRAVVVSPTRELAQQIFRVFDQLATPIKLRVRLLDKSNASANTFGKGTSMKFDVLISTPLRLVHGLSKEALSLERAEWLVLDEADRLFENGFDEQIDEIIAACNKPGRTIALFSATMPQRVEELARSVLLDPIRVRVGEQNAATADIDQRLMFVGNEMGKLIAMRQLVQEGIKPPVLIFVQSKGRAKELFHELVYDGINVDVIHADRTKEQRDDVVRQFRSGKVWVMICTDLMARGLDFKGVNLVINYDFPGNAVDYIHRIGRTGRAGREGKAITFFTEADGGNLRTIANVMKSSGCDVPSWMLEVKSKRKGKSRVIERESISTSLQPTQHRPRKKRTKTRKETNQ